MNNPCFIRVEVESIPTIIEALKAAGKTDEATHVEEFSRQYTDQTENADRLEWLKRADELAKDGEIEFDSDAAISGSEGGQYLLGWVWIDAPDEDLF